MPRRPHRVSSSQSSLARWDQCAELGGLGINGEVVEAAQRVGAVAAHRGLRRRRLARRRSGGRGLLGLRLCLWLARILLLRELRRPLGCLVAGRSGRRGTGEASRGRGTGQPRRWRRRVAAGSHGRRPCPVQLARHGSSVRHHLGASKAGDKDVPEKYAKKGGRGWLLNSRLVRQVTLNTQRHHPRDTQPRFSSTPRTTNPIIPPKS